MKYPIIKTTEQQWRTVRSETHNNIILILNAIDILIKNMQMGVVQTEILISTGLYSHAIEEYGKLLYLQSLKPVNDIVEIKYDGGEFKDHDYKFKLALTRLPNKCKILNEGNFGSHNFGNHNFGQDTVANWQTRLHIFNTDLNCDGTVKNYPIVRIRMLEAAVTEFRKEVNNTIP